MGNDSSLIKFNEYLIKCCVCHEQLISTAYACQVYPSEYAYRDDSVNSAESASANCRRYPIMDGLPASFHSTDYIHCDGTQLILADRNLGSELPFSSSSHYQWSAGSGEQLLFIFPTRVSLTTITLHYYSDSVRGLPRLRFYAVRHNFDIWNTVTANTLYVEVASVSPGGEPAGHRSVGINVNFNTNKVLMYKFSSFFQFAVSEVEFSTCSKNILVIYNTCYVIKVSIVVPTTASSEYTIPSMGPTIDHDGEYLYMQ